MERCAEKTESVIERGKREEIARCKLEGMERRQRERRRKKGVKIERETHIRRNKKSRMGNVHPETQRENRKNENRERRETREGESDQGIERDDIFNERDQERRKILQTPRKKNTREEVDLINNKINRQIMDTLRKRERKRGKMRKRHTDERDRER